MKYITQHNHSYRQPFQCRHNLLGAYTQAGDRDYNSSVLNMHAGFEPMSLKLDDKRPGPLSQLITSW